MRIVAKRSAGADWPVPLNGHVELTVPRRDFAMLRRALVVLLVATVVLPAGFLLYYGVASWHKALDDASGFAMRSSRIIEEQALKVFELNEVIRERVLQSIHDTQLHDGTLTGSAFTARLRDIAAPFDHLAAVSVYDASGQLVVTNDPYLGVPRSLAQTDAFRNAARWSQGDYITEAMPLRGHRDRIFNVVTPRHFSDGSFAGVIALSVRSSYFEDFYRELVTGSHISQLALMRNNGTWLARYPPLAPGDVEPPVPHGVLAAQVGGTERVRLPDAQAIIGYRRIGSRDIYVTDYLRLDQMFSRWLARTSIVTACSIIPSIALFLVAFIALRRLDSEEKAWRQWQAEASLRRAAEEDYRHALKMESLGRLTGSIAHDFNNLLMVLSANARLIRLKGDNDGMDKQWRAIERAVQTGEALTRRLLSVSRKQPTRAERIELHSRLAEWKELIDASAGARCDVRIAVPDNVWPVFADPTDLQLALINLVANARDALPAGGRIAICANNHRAARERAGGPPAAEPSMVRIAVSDNGCGMSPSVAARAFEPFFTTKELGKGTGLGLPQVYGFCQQAGGDAQIISHPGVGTTVAMFLPAVQPCGQAATPDGAILYTATHGASATTHDAHAQQRPPVRATDTPAQATPASAGSREAAASVSDAAGDAPASDRPTDPSFAHRAPSGGIGLNLLLVEDDHEVAEATAAVLNLDGHRVTTAPDAHSALETYCQQARYDAVISDVTMPGAMNGIDLAIALRDADPGLPVILVTGHTDKLSLAQREGLLVLPKPVNFDALRSALPHPA